MATYSVTISDRVKLSPSLSKGVLVALQNTLRVQHAVSGIIARTAAVHDVARFTNVLSGLRRSPITVRDTLRLRSALAGQGTYGLTLRDRFKLRSALATIARASLRSTVALRPRLTAAQKVALRDTVRVAARMGLSAVYTASLRSAVRIKDGKPTFALGAFLRSRVALAANLTRTYHAYAALDEEVGLHDALTRKAVLTVVSHDTLRLSATAALRAVYRGTLHDHIDFTLDIIEPNGDVTTWAMNTRTGAVTEYLNYDFNSFAKSGSNTYLGAASDGLYELVGQDDAGTPVIADIVSGLVEFSGAFLSSLKAAYLGIRGEGEFFLKIVSGEGKTYVYGLQSRNLHTTRVNIGKGLRARYFTWELLSTGQDFDLTAVTFLPLQSTRRV